MVESEMVDVVNLIDKVLQDRENASTISQVKASVKEMMGHRPLFAW